MHKCTRGHFCWFCCLLHGGQSCCESEQNLLFTRAQVYLVFKCHNCSRDGITNTSKDFFSFKVDLSHWWPFFSCSNLLRLIICCLCFYLPPSDMYLQITDAKVILMRIIVEVIFSDNSSNILL